VKATAETYTYRATRAGKLVEAERILGEHTARFIVPELDITGRWQGRIDHAIYSQKNLGKLLTGAKRIEVTVKGRDYRDKPHRFKITIEPEKATELRQLVVGRIIGHLAAHGWRTQYVIEIVRWDKARTSKTHVQRKKQLFGVTISIVVHK